MGCWRAVAVNAPMLCWPPKDYISRLLRLARHGDVVPMSMCRRIFLVNDPHIVKVICQGHGDGISKNTYHYRQFSKCMGQGSLTLDGDSWVAARQRCQQAFWPDAINAYDAVMHEHVVRWRDDWLAVADCGGRLDVHRDIATRIFSLSAAILLGVSLSMEQASKIFSQMTHLVDQSVSSPWLTVGGVSTRFHREVAGLDRWLLSIAKQGHTHAPLLAPIFTAFSQHKISEAQYLGEIKNILFASFDTMSLSLTWGCYELARHESVQDQLVASMTSCLQKDSTALGVYQHCAPVRHLIQEVLRLYPAVYGIERRLHRVPSSLRHLFKDHTLLRFSPYLLHRHPGYWQHPLAFYPDRFKQDYPMSHRYAYCPYLLGPRNCMGQHLANAVMAKVWTTLLPSIGFCLSSAQAVVMNARITLRPLNGVVLRLWRRP